MKAYVMKVVVIDFDGYGPDECSNVLIDNRYVDASICDVVQYDIGEWTDEHPLNQHGGHAWLNTLEAEVV